jgi:hypothetical protein
MRPSPPGTTCTVAVPSSVAGTFAACHSTAGASEGGADADGDTGMGVDEARGDRVGSSSAGCVGLTGPPHATSSAATNVAARAEMRFMRAAWRRPLTETSVERRRWAPASGDSWAGGNVAAGRE